MRVSFGIPTVAIANAIKVNLGCGAGTDTGKRRFSRLCLQPNRFVPVRSLYVEEEEET